jgi:hypothetical protein
METMIRYASLKGFEVENYFDHDERNALVQINQLIARLVNNSIPFKMITVKKK